MVAKGRLLSNSLDMFTVLTVFSIVSSNPNHIKNMHILIDNDNHTCEPGFPIPNWIRATILAGATDHGLSNSACFKQLSEKLPSDTFRQWEVIHTEISTKKGTLNGFEIILCYRRSVDVELPFPFCRNSNEFEITTIGQMVTLHRHTVFWHPASDQLYVFGSTVYWVEKGIPSTETLPPIFEKFLEREFQ
jgi:hypothetical protein